ncbi:MAG: GyrI-like domain-containing protein [Coprobacillaceae bacterium]
MTRVSKIFVHEHPTQYIVSVRSTMNFMVEYEKVSIQTHEQIMHYLKELDILPADGPIVCFHNTDLEALDVEIGFPIPHSIEDKDSIKCHVIKQRKMVTTIDYGPYEKQDPTLMELMEWISKNGYQSMGPIYYQYLNEDNRPNEDYLTKMMIPIT